MLFYCTVQNVHANTMSLRAAAQTAQTTELKVITRRGLKYKQCKQSLMEDNTNPCLHQLLPVDAALHLKPSMIVLPLTIAEHFLHDQHKLKKDIITHRHIYPQIK